MATQHVETRSGSNTGSSAGSTPYVRDFGLPHQAPNGSAYSHDPSHAGMGYDNMPDIGSLPADFDLNEYIHLGQHTLSSSLSHHPGVAPHQVELEQQGVPVWSHSGVPVKSNGNPLSYLNIGFDNGLAEEHPQFAGHIPNGASMGQNPFHDPYLLAHQPPPHQAGRSADRRKVSVSTAAGGQNMTTGPASTASTRSSRSSEGERSFHTLVTSPESRSGPGSTGDNGQKMRSDSLGGQGVLLPPSAMHAQPQPDQPDNFLCYTTSPSPTMSYPSSMMPYGGAQMPAQQQNVDVGHRQQASGSVAPAYSHPVPHSQPRPPADSMPATTAAVAAAIVAKTRDEGADPKTKAASRQRLEGMLEGLEGRGSRSPPDATGLDSAPQPSSSPQEMYAFDPRSRPHSQMPTANGWTVRQPQPHPQFAANGISQQQFSFASGPGEVGAMSMEEVLARAKAAGAYDPNAPMGGGLPGDHAAQAATAAATQPGGEGHNAVEKRYRTRINDCIAELADLVPALAHLRSLPSAATSRRHSSQFIVSTSSIGKIPTGLVDGVKAATKLSKGNILAKSVDYIRHLRRTRDELLFDIGEFKMYMRQAVPGGDAHIARWEEHVRAKIPERDRARYAEQASDEDEDDDVAEEDGIGGGNGIGVKKGAAASKKRKASDMKATGKGKPAAKRPAGERPLTQFPAPFHTSSHPDPMVQQGFDVDVSQQASIPGFAMDGFQAHPPHHVGGPSPASSGSSPNGYSPPGAMTSSGGIMLSHVQPYDHAHQSTRHMLAAFTLLTFGGFTGLHVYGRADPSGPPPTRASDGVRASTMAKHWAPAGAPINPARLNPMAIDAAAFQAGFNAVGVLSTMLLLLALFRPSLLLRVTGDPKSDRRRGSPASDETVGTTDSASLLSDPNENHVQLRSRSKEQAMKEALHARKQWLKVAGGPSTALAAGMGLAQEAMIAAIRSAKDTLHLGGSDFARPPAVSLQGPSDAWTWMRIAEVEVALGPSQTSKLSRLYTSLRLYNLSRSTDWRYSASPAQSNFPRINAVLSLHARMLFGDGNLLSQALWKQSVAFPRRKTEDEKKDEDYLDQALSGTFAEACNILGKDRVSSRLAEPSDTLPLLRIAEVRCEVALVEVWSRMFVATVKRTCPLPPTAPPGISLDDGITEIPINVAEASPAFALQVSAARAVMEESITHIFATSMPGSTVRTLACVARGYWGLGFGRPDVAEACAGILAREAMDGGQALELACVAAFLELVYGPRKAEVNLGPEQRRTPITNADKLATATLRWLPIRKRHFIRMLEADKAADSTTVEIEAGDRDGEKTKKSTAKGDVELHRATVKLRVLINDPCFSEPEIIKASSKQTEEARARGEPREYNLVDATTHILKATDDIGKRAAGLRPYGAAGNAAAEAEDSLSEGDVAHWEEEEVPAESLDISSDEEDEDF